MNLRIFSLSAAILGLPIVATVSLAQNIPPVVSSQIADFTEYAGAPARSIDLSTNFTDPDASAAIRLTTVLGNIDLILHGAQKPITVANFLNYVDQGRYFKIDPTTGQLASSFIHRSEPGFVIQGGGFLGTVDSSNTSIQPTAVLTFPAIQNEPGISNRRGTIAMAKLGNDPNSATSQWFINLADNGGPPNNLDTVNGGFTVFGRVVGNGMTVVDAIAALPRFNAGSPFDELPLRNYNGTSNVQVANLISLPGIAPISPFTFSATSDNTNVVSVAVSGTKLLVSGHVVGLAHITVTATDLEGASVSQNFTVNVVAAPGRLVNISTRLQVGTVADALIGGFIVRGGSSKRLMVRGIGPSLGSSGLTNLLANPILELHDQSGALISSNDNWGDAANKQDIIDTGIAPAFAGESAILTDVPSDGNGIAYTAILRGVNNTTGIGLVEVYDLDSGAGSTILNISTRGRVDQGDNVMVGGIILGGSEAKPIVIRAIGPSLANAGVPNSLSDPVLELHNAQGALIDSNDDWQSGPRAADIQASGLAPTDPKESAILNTLAPAAYTAIVRGTGSTPTGVALVEAYQLP